MQRSHALLQVRDEYEYWVNIEYYDDEASKLGQFMSKAIYDAVLRDVIDNLPEQGRSMAENTIVSIMNGMTKGAASGAWNGARAAAEKLEPILKEKMKPLIEPYVCRVSNCAERPVAQLLVLGIAPKKASSRPKSLKK